jgi:hypothetical protein
LFRPTAKAALAEIFLAAVSMETAPVLSLLVGALLLGPEAVAENRFFPGLLAHGQAQGARRPGASEGATLRKWSLWAGDSERRGDAVIHHDRGLNSQEWPDRAAVEDVVRTERVGDNMRVSAFATIATTVVGHPRQQPTCHPL